MTLFSFFKWATRTSIALGSVAVLSACHSSYSAQFTAGSATFPIQTAPYSEYLRQVKQYIEANRAFIGSDQASEVTMNMPFECGEQNNDVGLLLVHGLGDSPYFFRDIADAMCAQGIHVRTLLLKGHGTKPGDMLTVSYEQWQNETNFHVELFSREVDTLFIGGFSTGANLTTLTAFNRNDIAGLVHFSPAFKSRFFVSRLAPYIGTLFPWPNVEEEDNPTRYNSTAMPGFAAYQESVNALQARFNNKDESKRTLHVPVLMVVAEDDSVVDTKTVAKQYRDNFTHPKKCLLWQGGSAPNVMPQQLKMQSMELPEQQISAASHMSPLFSKGNAFYGTQSAFRICDNGQGADKEAICKAGGDIWYGPWGYKEEGKVHARLTYNPYFEELVSQLVAFTHIEKTNALCH
ncbi:alpha/beta hydrolase [Alteromonas sp. MTD1]|uniref:alpha/beta hydrolase n=1 Tax=Alteromonas sp. MTD1 TaxID=3057962 RepID=UPI0036F2A3C6